MKKYNEFLKYQKLKAQVIGGVCPEKIRGDINDLMVYAINHGNWALVDELEILMEHLEIIAKEV